MLALEGSVRIGGRSVTQMYNRRELETLLVTGIQELQTIESSLDRRFGVLGKASEQTRKSFVLKLVALEKKASQLEQIVDALEGSRRNPLMAA
jgi:hypothetical protein